MLNTKKLFLQHLFEFNEHNLLMNLISAFLAGGVMSIKKLIEYYFLKNVRPGSLNF